MFYELDSFNSRETWHGITCDGIVGDRGEMPVIICSMNWTVSTHMRHGITGDAGVGDC